MPASHPAASAKAASRSAPERVVDLAQRRDELRRWQAPPIDAQLPGSETERLARAAGLLVQAPGGGVVPGGDLLLVAVALRAPSGPHEVLGAAGPRRSRSERPGRTTPPPRSARPRRRRVGRRQRQPQRPPADLGGVGSGRLGLQRRATRCPARMAARSAPGGLPDQILDGRQVPGLALAVGERVEDHPLDLAVNEPICSSRLRSWVGIDRQELLGDQPVEERPRVAGADAGQCGCRRPGEALTEDGATCAAPPAPARPDDRAARPRARECSAAPRARRPRPPAGSAARRPRRPSRLGRRASATTPPRTAARRPHARARCAAAASVHPSTAAATSVSMSASLSGPSSIARRTASTASSRSSGRLNTR